MIQLFLMLAALILSFIFYYKYFYKVNINDISSKDSKIFSENDEKIDSNIVKNIYYESTDNEGNQFIIKSDFGRYNDEDREIINMTNVTAEMNFKDGTKIDLTSKNAKYNTYNSDTNFFNNVNLVYLDHLINSDHLNIFFKDSRLEAYSNLVYRNLDLSLIADKVEMDLLTKDSKIFMLNDKKVKVLKSN